MVAMLIGLLLISAVSGTYVWTSRSHRQDDSTARLQENARFAMETVEKDLQMAGFMHEVLTSSTIDTSLVDGSLNSDCGASGVAWGFDTTNLIEVLDKASATDVSTQYNCIDASSLHTIGTSGSKFTNALAIKRVKGSTGSPLDGKIYLQTTIDGRARMIAHNLSTNPADSAYAGATNWEYLTNIYYIDRIDDDGYPVLFRKTLQGENLDGGNTLLIDTEAGGVAEGIEYLHITWGIDNEMIDGNSATKPDGNPNYFTSSPTATELPGVVAAKIYVLVRSRNFDVTYVDDKQYLLGDLTLPTAGTFNDNFRRKVFSTTIKLRNRVIKNNALTIIKS